MDKKVVKFIDNDCGDWEILKLNGETYFEGHSIPTHVWLDIISALGAEVKKETIEQEDI